MASLDELIGKAASAPTPTQDVQVSLDAGVSQRLEDLDAELKTLALNKRLTDPRPKKVQAEIEKLEAEAAESIVTFRFTRLDAQEWAGIAARAAARRRVDVPLDNVGYHYHEVTMTAAVLSGKQVEGDKLVDVSSESWQKLWKVLSGNDLERICSAVFDLNVWTSTQDFLAGSRASAAGTETKSS